jgi:ABC-type nitrate/sulfonate/bicarbonate transport system substrate-binding protein
MEGRRAIARLIPAVLLMTAVFLASLAGLIGCGGKAVVEPMRLTLGTYKGELNALIYVAQDQGYFARNDLAVDIRDYESGVAAVNELKAGKVDVATAAEFVFVNNAFTRPDLRIISSIAEADVNRLVARAGAGIGSFADLKGKKVGVTQRSSAEYFLRTLIVLNGLKPEDVQIVYGSPAELVEAIGTGAVDAVVTWEPNAYNIRQSLGDKVEVWSAQGGQAQYWLLIGSDGLTSERPEAVDRLLRSLAQAEDFVQRDPQAAQDITARYIDMPGAYVEYVWGASHYALLLPQELLLVMEGEARWAIRNGYTDAKEAPNYLNLLYLGGMLEVKPEAVTVIH